MFGFGRRKKRPEGTAQTFVEATGGGWGDVPDELPADGGVHADYVGEVLQRARDYADEHDIKVREEFMLRITDIPRGIRNPQEIVFGIMSRAHDYGLIAGAMFDEKVYFTRLD